MQNYGHILPQELEQNREQLAKPYDATSEPLQILFDRFEEATIFVLDGGLSITDAQLINSGIVSLANTGVLERFIDQWNDKTPQGSCPYARNEVRTGSNLQVFHNFD
jgi:hypothetical protein